MIEFFNILLFKEFSQGLILPTKDSSSNLKNLTLNKTSSQQPKSTEKTAPSSQNQELNGSAKILTKKLSLTEDFKCRVNELYDVFTNIEVILIVQEFKYDLKCFLRWLELLLVHPIFFMNQKKEENFLCLILMFQEIL